MFACMELSRSAYIFVSEMPIKRFYNYLKWKTDLEEDKKKMVNEEIAKRGR